ncbi:ABC transporter ATP-binding protein [Kitasatospora sp. NBC_01287]|uniref:ATP-binding cassette domain-containing protein n=1 Tax=Kitasatospora sp. NBC_01287 TaxID=2903573 RepID=UPI0022580826|nr:ABC transporter ATP-binding protein [Kitasatospora sp. NBC_01287]MCX4744930.1 ABC transporter ATP-binding protein [Kitasatospora sp. NBC_01287]
MEITGKEVTARGISVRGPRGPVFENVDVDVPAGGLLVVHGPAASGRTSLLLALAGRMRLSAGAVRVGADTAPGRGGRRIRQAVAVARAEPAVGLEGRLRVRELVAERCWLERGVTPRRIVEAARLLGLRLRADAWAEELPPLDALLLATALALAARPAVLVVDAVDHGCPDDERERAWRALGAARSTGCTVLAGATQAPPTAPDGADGADGTDGTVLIALPRRSADLLAAPDQGRHDASDTSDAPTGREAAA